MEKTNESKYPCRNCNKSFEKKPSTGRNPSFEKVGRAKSFLCLKCEEAIAYAQRVDVEYHERSAEPSLRNHDKIKSVRAIERARREKR